MPWCVRCQLWLSLRLVTACRILRRAKARGSLASTLPPPASTLPGELLSSRFSPASCLIWKPPLPFLPGPGDGWRSQGCGLART